MCCCNRRALLATKAAAAAAAVLSKLFGVGECTDETFVVNKKEDA
jgi:hypothetical protein